MGIEYRLRFTSPDDTSFASLLGEFPGANPLGPPGAFQLRSPESAEGMPDAVVRAEPCGAYYCWFGGSGREMLGHLIARLVSRFGPVTVEDYE